MEDVRFLGRHIGVATKKESTVDGTWCFWDFVPGDKAIVAGVPAGFLMVNFWDNSFEVVLPREDDQKDFEKFIIPVTSIIQLIGEHIG